MFLVASQARIPGVFGYKHALCYCICEIRLKISLTTFSVERTYIFPFSFNFKAIITYYFFPQIQVKSSGGARSRSRNQPRARDGTADVRAHAPLRAGAAGLRARLQLAAPRHRAGAPQGQWESDELSSRRGLSIWAYCKL